MPPLSCSARSVVVDEPDPVLGLPRRVVRFEIQYLSKDKATRVVKSFEDVRKFYELNHLEHLKHCKHNEQHNHQQHIEYE